MPFSHVVLINSDGTVWSTEKADNNPYLGEKPEHRLNATALPVVVNTEEYSLEGIVTKESKLPDRIIRIERPQLAGEANMMSAWQDDCERVDFVVNYVKKSTYSGKVLEIGCSGGIITLRLARASNCHVLGVDIRSEAIEEANDLVKNEYADVDKRVCFCRIKGDETDFGEQYDAVLLLEVLEHLSDDLQLKILQLAYNSVKPDCPVLISVPNRWPDEKYEMENRSRWKWDAHIAFFSLASFVELVGRVFSDVQPIVFLSEEKPEDGIWLHVVARR